ncbi:MAG: cation transporter [Erythrobacteraceae bacterium]|jgi:cobalt-zinc-cadmium efflux system protein|nr:cation transporter [Erythrobacteraceae bacterium]
MGHAHAHHHHHGSAHQGACHGAHGGRILSDVLLLAITIGAILLETIHRLMEPQAPQGMAMIVVAGIGIGIKALTAMLFVRGQEDLNIRGAYLHMAADALVSVGVLLAGAAILLTGLVRIDAAVSLVIVAVIVWGTSGLARDSAAMDLLNPHLVMPERPASDNFLHAVAASLRARFGVDHATLQSESDEHHCGAYC